MKTLFIALGLLVNLCAQAQLVKLYATKDDYVDNKYEVPNQTVTIRNFMESKENPQYNALYYFWTNDNALRSEIGRKTFLVEYNDSLYLNTYLLKNEKKERFGHGFVKVKDQGENIFFETLPTESLSPTPLLSLGFADKIALQATPTIYYHYDPATDRAKPINKQQLTDILKQDTELLSLFEKEVNQENIEVLSSYAKAFFMRKALQEKEAQAREVQN